MNRRANAHLQSVGFLALILLGVAGCSTPTTNVNPTAKLSIYRKVYLSSGSSQNDPRKVYPRVAERLTRAGFEVINVRPGEPLGGQGTGFVITEAGQVLTCAHVLEGSTNATLWIQGVRQVGRVVLSDTNIDLAIVAIDSAREPFHPLTFAAMDEYHMGQDVYTLGFPLVDILGTAPRLNKGLLSSTVGLGDNTNQVQVSAEVQPGNSGGPLLNDNGDAIGVVTGTLNPINILARSGGSLPQNVNFAVRMGPIRKFLDAQKLVLPSAPEEKRKNPFEEAEKSVALIRAGIVTEEDLKEPKLFCRVEYLSRWDIWYRFIAFQVDFFDTKSGEQVFRSGIYRDDFGSSEDAVMDRVFKAICASFFPDRPNPFSGKSTPSKPESQAPAAGNSAGH